MTGLRKRAEDEMDDDPVLGRLLKDIAKDKARLNELTDLDTNLELSRKIDESLMNGLNRGRGRTNRDRRRRISLQIGAAAIVMFFMLTAFVRISPAFAAFMKEIPGFGGFVELISFDRSLITALHNEYMQIVNKSDERNGFKFTVNGVIADSQRVVLLYTAEGPGINEEDSTFLPYELKDENGKNISAVMSSSHYYREVENKNAGVQDYLDITMSPGVPVPQEIRFRLQVGSEWLEVHVPVDHAKFEGMREEIVLNESIEIANQKILIQKAVITPLQVSITFVGDKENEKRLNDFIGLELVDDRGRSYTTNMGMGDLDTELTRHFQSSYFEKPKSLTLKAEGLMLSERNVKIVIDTEKEQMLASPDSRLRLVDVIKKDQDIDLIFELNQQDDPDDSMRGISLFANDGVVRDASGTSYMISSGDSTGENFASYRSSEPLGTYYYHIPNADYEQPLTFDVNQYLGHVLQDISVKIK
ncbi:DUF4179 domain-containing protein [Paenibacillus nanensis]|uniref:DUF4179 domain-containing protein n=1 Tax=Paenibacillus nanensis TaxID=393251 RepID=A0A3A1UH06_9BACL|nr:DUF4179 domain-containing protein [Paenibacillus nanensis]RIX45840.1 DUF4179 domain-containing protein [Paenibacillus nanensis]